MLSGVIQIHDLDGAGKVSVGQIPDPDGPVSEDDFGWWPTPNLCTKPRYRCGSQTPRRFRLRLHRW